MILQHNILDYYPAAVPPEADIQANAGYFTAFKLENFSAEKADAPSVYCRRNFYKAILIAGDATYHFGDNKIALQKGQYALVFTNRVVPYRWEVHSGACQGYVCMFDDDFFPLHTYLRPADWSVFNAGEQSFFHLNSGQARSFINLFRKMIKEQNSGYPNKFDLLFHNLMECVHGAIKLTSTNKLSKKTAAEILTESFRSEMSTQFANLSANQRLQTRTAQDFADKLAVHVNYLNRALKSATGKTTTQLLTERIIQEARVLLLHTNLPISQISHILRFEEPTNFTQFFHKHAQVLPSSIRQV